MGGAVAGAAMYWVPRLLDDDYTTDNFKTDLALGPSALAVGPTAAIALILSTDDPVGELKQFGVRAKDEAVAVGVEAAKFAVTNAVVGAVWGTPVNIARWLGLW